MPQSPAEPLVWLSGSDSCKMRGGEPSIDITHLYSSLRSLLPVKTP